MMFKRKLKKTKSLCFHDWRVADFEVYVDSDGTCTDYTNLYVLGCDKCKSSRKVDEFVFKEMERIGLIKEDR